MNIPKLRKISEVDIKAKAKVEEIINKVQESEAIFSTFPIEEFTLEELDLLAEYARKNNLIVFLKAEYSNFYQGVLVEISKKDKFIENIKYL